MSRSPDRAAALVIALSLLAPAVARGQGPQVLDLQLPVEDLVLEESSLDNSVATQESPKSVRVTLAADVLFRFDKASLSPRANGRIAEVAARIETAAPRAVKVDGYTDSKGSGAYNLGLSRRRAAAVVAALRAQLGSAAPKLATRGHGEADPVAANTKKDGGDNPKGRARNRRVTITFAR